MATLASQPSLFESLCEAPCLFRLKLNETVPPRERVLLTGVEKGVSSIWHDHDKTKRDLPNSFCSASWPSSQGCFGV